MTAEQVAAGAAAIQTLVVLGALFYARAQLTEAKDARAAQDRPYVIVDLELSKDDPHDIEAVIRNVGQTAATDVQFEFEPPLAFGQDYNVAQGPLGRGLSMLAPGREIRLLFDQMIERGEANLPGEYRVSISYRGGGVKPDELHRDPVYVLSVDVYEMMPRVWPKTIDDVAETLWKIERTLHNWTGSKEYGHALVVMNPDQARAERDKMFKRMRPDDPDDVSSEEPTE